MKQRRTRLLQLSVRPRALSAISLRCVLSPNNNPNKLTHRWRHLTSHMTQRKQSSVDTDTHFKTGEYSFRCREDTRQNDSNDLRQRSLSESQFESQLMAFRTVTLWNVWLWSMWRYNVQWNDWYRLFHASVGRRVLCIPRAGRRVSNWATKWAWSMNTTSVVRFLTLFFFCVQKTVSFSRNRVRFQKACPRKPCPKTVSIDHFETLPFRQLRSSSCVVSSSRKTPLCSVEFHVRKEMLTRVSFRLTSHPSRNPRRRSNYWWTVKNTNAHKTSTTTKEPTINIWRRTSWSIYWGMCNGCKIWIFWDLGVFTCWIHHSIWQIFEMGPIWPICVAVACELNDGTENDLRNYKMCQFDRIAMEFSVFLSAQF